MDGIGQIVTEMEEIKTEPEDGPVSFPVGLKEDDVVKLCDMREDDFKQHIKQFADRWKRDEALALCEGEVAKMDSNAPFVPVAHSQFETSVANVMRATIGKPKVIELKPRFYTEDTDRQQVVEDFVNQELLYGNNRRPNWAMAFKSSMLKGLTICKSVWDVQTIVETREKRSDVSDMNGNFPVIDFEEMEITRGRWGFEPVPIPNIAWDVRQTVNIQDCEWVRQRHYYSAADLKDMEKAGKIEGVNEIMKKAPVQEIDGNKVDFNGTKTWQIDEWWGTVSWDYTGEDGNAVFEVGRYRWMRCGNKVISFTENPLSPKRIPYCSGRYQPTDKSLVGNSVFTPIAQLNIAATNQMGEKRKSIRNIVNAPTFYEPSSGLDVEAAKTGNGGYIAVKDSSRINKPPSDTTAVNVLSQDISSYIGMMNSATPANEQFQGVGGSDNTATEANINYQSGGVRFGEVVETLSSELIASLARECFLMNKQFAEDGDMWVSESSINGTVMMLPKDSLLGDYDFIAVGASSEANKRLDVKAKLEMLKIAATLPPESTSNGMVKRFKLQDFLIREGLPSVGVKNGLSYIEEVPAQAVQMTGEQIPETGIPAEPGDGLPVLPQ